MDQHLDNALVSQPVIVDDYIHNVKQSYHLRITPYKFLDETQDIDLVRKILETASTPQYPILYSVEKEGDLNVHFHIILTKPHFEIVGKKIKELGAKGNGSSSKTIIRNPLKCIKYVLKDGIYWDEHHTEPLRKWFVSLCRTTFRKHNEYKTELITLEDEFLMLKLNNKEFLNRYVRLQVDFNRSNGLEPYAIKRYFRFLTLRKLKRNKNEEKYNDAITDLISHLIL